MSITEYIPRTSDNDEMMTPLDEYCATCEQIIMRARGWTLLQTKDHVGRFMRELPKWAAAGISVERAVTRMIGGNPTLGYR